ncbi:uncharacterized protein LOC125051210 [Pieris napi]|uniref:uncharacterized protein LOC125051210 n=1 Tax=Pieris napi TaxID=78633 RepID=UPI001FB93F23|nr:uncharacterized protein LOC125051210 [Pieris napi]
MPDVRFYDNMLFNYETTNRTYFQPEIINYYPPTLYQEKVSRPRPAYKPLKNIHTLTEFKKHDLPTELFANQKQIIRKDAHKVHSAGIENPVEEGKNHVQATRPRLVMPPALSLDDIKDSSIRELLIKDIYQSSVNVMQTDVSTATGGCRAPLDGKYSPANPMAFAKLQMPVVPPEWRMDSVTWDNRQVRGHCNPDKSFYLSQPLRCEVCISTSERKAQKKTKYSNNKLY